ncbi:hypothetical protein J4G37_37000, partial [Microvirga sp. 3-52]|nr:hypothetical protein [Microvirga sp. 3-52]
LSRSVLINENLQCDNVMVFLNVLTGRIRYLKYAFHLVLKGLELIEIEEMWKGSGLDIYLYYFGRGILISNCLNAFYKN